MMKNNPPWIYKGEELLEAPEGYEGFVYLITTKDGRKYVGQKKYKFKRTKTVKGKRTRVTVASDWLDYYGSNEEMQQLVETSGPDGFKREILHLCRTKSEMNYLESLEILSRGALLSDEYLNRWVSIKINSGTVEHKLAHDPHIHAVEFKPTKK